MTIREKISKKLIKFTQKLINRLYKKEGVSDRVLEDQVKLNTLKNKLDINDSDEEFVQ